MAAPEAARAPARRESGEGLGVPPSPHPTGPTKAGRRSLLDGALHKLREWTRSAKTRGAKGSPSKGAPLTVLLLSSLHITAKGKAQTLLDDRLRALVQDIDRLRHGTALPPIDLLVVAGDVTAWGRAAEMAHAREVLRHLVRALSCDGVTPALVLVPGNHDIAKAKPDWRAAVSRGLDLDDVMRQRQNLGFAKKTGTDYRALVEHLHQDGVVPRAPQMEPYTLLGIEHEHGGRTLALRGLDSAWAQPWTDKGKGLLGSQQLAQALPGLEGADLRVAVVHHVRSMMDPDEWDVLDDAFDLVITGSDHGGSEAIQVTARGTIVVQSPGLVGSARPGYAVLELGVTMRARVRYLDEEDDSSMVYELPWPAP